MKATTTLTATISILLAYGTDSTIAGFLRSRAALVSPERFEQQGWQLQGCYLDVGRTINDAVWTDSGMTNAKCTAFCFEKGYVYAGTEYSSECYCGDFLARGAQPANGGDCNFRCAGSSTEACGGSSRLTLYKTDQIIPPSVSIGVGDWESMGCYIEGSTGRALERQISSIPGVSMTATQCLAACESEGYSLSGVEYGNECFCGNELKNSARAALLGGCEMGCSGDRTQLCGGVRRLNLYYNKLLYDGSLSPSPTPTTGLRGGGETPAAQCPNQPAQVGPEWTFDGCYTEGNGIRALSSQSYSDAEMSLLDCSQFCEGFAYFGVEYSRECYCGNDFQGGSAKTAASECDMLCPGITPCNNCGAGNRLSVYTSRNISSVDPSSTGASLSSTYTVSTTTSRSDISSGSPSSASTVSSSTLSIVASSSGHGSTAVTTESSLSSQGPSLSLPPTSIASATTVPSVIATDTRPTSATAGSSISSQSSSLSPPPTTLTTDSSSAVLPTASGPSTVSSAITTDTSSKGPVTSVISSVSSTITAVQDTTALTSSSSLTPSGLSTVSSAITTDTKAPVTSVLSSVSSTTTAGQDTAVITSSSSLTPSGSSTVSAITTDTSSKGPVTSVISSVSSTITAGQDTTALTSSSSLIPSGSSTVSAITTDTSSKAPVTSVLSSVSSTTTAGQDTAAITSSSSLTASGSSSTTSLSVSTGSSTTFSTLSSPPAVSSTSVATSIEPSTDNSASSTPSTVATLSNTTVTNHPSSTSKPAGTSTGSSQGSSVATTETTLTTPCTSPDTGSASTPQSYATWSSGSTTSVVTSIPTGFTTVVPSTGQTTISSLDNTTSASLVSTTTSPSLTTPPAGSTSGVQNTTTVLSTSTTSPPIYTNTTTLSSLTTSPAGSTYTTTSSSLTTSLAGSTSCIQNTTTVLSTSPTSPPSFTNTTTSSSLTTSPAGSTYTTTSSSLSTSPASSTSCVQNTTTVLSTSTTSPPPIYTNTTTSSGLSTSPAGSTSFVQNTTTVLSTSTTSPPVFTNTTTSSLTTSPASSTSCVQNTTTVLSTSTTSPPVFTTTTTSSLTISPTTSTSCIQNTTAVLSTSTTSPPVYTNTTAPSSFTTISPFANATSSMLATSATTSTALPTSTGLLPPGWDLYGCWVDGVNGRILDKQLPDSQNLTLQSCALSCANANYTVAGTEFSTQCFCGHNIINGGAKAQSETECNSHCSGNATQTCGGPDRMTIMSVGEPKVQLPPAPVDVVGNWKYQGCYEDNVNQTRTFFWQSFFPNIMTPEMCLDSCAAYGYMAAGLEYGSECYCGDPENIIVNHSSKQNDTECNMPCAGNASAICGGGSHLSTYFWDAEPFYSWDFPEAGTPEAGEYKFLIGGVTIPLISSQAITGKVTFLEKFGTGPPNSTGAYELDLSEIDDFNAAWRTMHVKTDVFCAAGLTLPDKAGRQINIGGWSGASLYGVRLYTPDGSDGVKGTNDWEEDPSILKLQDGRWYPTAMNMANGSMLIIGGEDGSNGAPVPTLEILPYTGTKPLHMDWLERTDPNNLYPFAAVLPSGGIFVAYWNEARILDENTFATIKTLPMIPGAVNDPKGGRTYPLEGTAVLLPQHAPYTDPLGVLICGGSTNGPGNALDNCVSTYPDAAQPTWELERMPSPRVMSCMAPLPDGTYIIMNGAHHGVAGFGLGVGPNLNALLYDPKKPIGHRITVMANTTVARLYHSESITLLDGRVLVTGSDPQDGVNPQEYRMETFIPPYLLSGKPRPTFSIKDTDWSYGQQVSFSLGSLPVNGDITVSLLGSVSSTHGNSMGARTLFPAMSCSGTSCTVTAPPGKYIAPPGWYQFFVLDGGIPAVGVFVRIGGDPAGLGNWPEGSAFTQPGV